MKSFWHHEPQESPLQRTEGAQRAPSVLCNDDSTHFFVLYLIFSHGFQSEFQKYPIIRLIILFPANTHYHLFITMDDWMPMSVWVEFIVFYSGSIMIVIGSIGEQFVLLLSEINVLVNLYRWFIFHKFYKLNKYDITCTLVFYTTFHISF